jgi:HSP20 family molecular chaperone IbpA
MDTANYWVSERSIGEFLHNFSFPGHVDQDEVRGSFKDGILSIVVPKAKRPDVRRIAIE